VTFRHNAGNSRSALLRVGCHGDNDSGDGDNNNYFYNNNINININIRR
jgi:hypothetical protein